jgi:hypothetical protein
MVVIGRPSAEAAAFREILADVEQALAAVAARSRHPGARQ